jgi:CubicO group peptidase (beta-lactamase class C family)
MKKNFVFIFAFLLICCSWSDIEGGKSYNIGNNGSRQEYINTIKNIENQINKLMRKKHLPAFAITIVDDQDIVCQKAFGMADIENKTEASTKTVFKLYSVAKLFTAIEIFREVEEGLIDLDNSILEYLPDFRIQSRNNEDTYITVKSILAHRSGLPRNGCVMIPAEKNDIHTLDRFERSTYDCFMAYPIGYRYKYSNLGYNLLGRIIEQNRNAGFSRYMKDHLLYDLGMRNSTFSLGDISDPELIAKGYEYYKHKYYPMTQPDINNVPSGNLYSTIEDLSVLLKDVINNEVFNSERTMSAMFVDHYSKSTDPETMGLGWKTTKIDGSEFMVWHDGGPTEGIGALVAILPYKKLGIAIVANSTSFEGSISVPFAIEILKNILETKSGIEYHKSVKPGRIEADRQLLNLYEGKYTAFGQLMDVKAKNNKLKGRIGPFGLDLIPVNETEFKVSHWMDKIGLTKIIRTPIDLDKIKIKFFRSDSSDSSFMIINMDNISFEICPKYPDLFNITGKWDFLAGDYQMAERLPDKSPGNFTGSHWNISLEDNVMIMSGVFGPIIPLNEKSLIIASGPFAGETIEYYPESGNLIHQNAVFVPLNSQAIR